jgi:hypothetical protein
VSVAVAPLAVSRCIAIDPASWHGLCHCPKRADKQGCKESSYLKRQISRRPADRSSFGEPSVEVV